MHYLFISNFKIMVNICHLMLFTNIVLFFMDFTKNGKAHKIFAIYLVIIFTGEMISKIMIYRKYENICMSHYYFVLQFIFLSLFYLEILNVAIQKKIIKIGLIVVPIILSIQYILNPKLIFIFNLVEVFICSLLIVVYAYFHFYNMLSHQKQYYYINIGILIYLFGSTIIFLAGNVMIVNTNHVGRFLTNINVILYMIYLTLIFIEWRKNYYNKTEL